MIELESPNFMGFAHEYHHEKDGVGLNTEDDFILSICFCEHCMARATKAGVDAEAARETVRGFIAAMCEREVPEKQFPDFPAAGIDAFKAWPALHAYLAWRTEPVTSLIAEIREATDPATRVILIDLKDGWLGGVDLRAVGKVCDGAILCGYDMTPEQVKSLIEKGRATLGADKYLGAGYRLFYPEMRSAEDVAARSKAAVDAGRRRHSTTTITASFRRSGSTGCAPRWTRSPDPSRIRACLPAARKARPRLCSSPT